MYVLPSVASLALEAHRLLGAGSSDNCLCYLRVISKEKGTIKALEQSLVPHLEQEEQQQQHQCSPEVSAAVSAAAAAAGAAAALISLLS